MDSLPTEQEFQGEREKGMESYIIGNKRLEEVSSFLWLDMYCLRTEDRGRTRAVRRGPSFFTLTLKLMVTHLEKQWFC